MDARRIFGRRGSSTVVALLVAALAGATPHSSALAQAGSGLGDDATLPGALSVRLTVGGAWTFAQSARQNGVDRSLGSRFSFDTLGAAQLPALQPVQDSVAALAGAPYTISLARTVASLSSRTQRIPIGVELGLTRWLAISAVVPIVRSTQTFALIANPGGAGGNVGFNPAVLTSGVSALVTDTTFTGQLSRSAAAVGSYCAGSGAGTTSCANSAGLVSNAARFAGTARALYGSGFLIPLRGSPAQNAIDARATSLRNALNAFAQISGSGVPLVSATGLAPAPAPLASPDVLAIIASGDLGAGSAPLESVDRAHVGDAEVTGKLQLLNTFPAERDVHTGPRAAVGAGVRLTLEGGYRFPTGADANPSNLLDVGIDTHAGAALARAYLDLGLGPHLWTSVSGRFTKPTTASTTVRLGSGAFPSEISTVTLDRTLGNTTELSLTPRWAFNDFVAIGAQYRYVRHATDTYGARGTSLVAPDDYTAGMLGAGISFSTVRAAANGRTRFPIELSFLHTATINAGGSAAVPLATLDQIQIRIYSRRAR